MTRKLVLSHSHFTMLVGQQTSIRAALTTGEALSEGLSWECSYSDVEVLSEGACVTLIPKAIGTGRLTVRLDGLEEWTLFTIADWVPPQRASS